MWEKKWKRHICLSHLFDFRILCQIVMKFNMRAYEKKSSDPIVWAHIKTYNTILTVHIHHARLYLHFVVIPSYNSN
jgi:hypothetical protein